MVENYETFVSIRREDLLLLLDGESVKIGDTTIAMCDNKEFTARMPKSCHRCPVPVENRPNCHMNRDELHCHSELWKYYSGVQ